jgi:hypothetical protein
MNEDVWAVDTEYTMEPGNYGNVKAKPGQVNYLNVVASTPKKQVKINPINIIAPLLGYRGNAPKTPAKQKPVAYGGKRKTKTRRYRSRSRKTYRRRK